MRGVGVVVLQILGAAVALAVISGLIGFLIVHFAGSGDAASRRAGASARAWESNSEQPSVPLSCRERSKSALAPLREGGSLPGIVEADDDGLYVVKFRGAGQGPKALVAELIAHAGRDQQRERWLRPLATGQAIGAFALSEPEAGTDAANQMTTAVRAGDGYRLRGRKVWVANAEEAKVVIVFASTRAGLRGQGVTAFLVPMDTPGIMRTARADSLGVRGLGCMDLELDVLVADDQVLGQVDQGFRLAMWALQGGRVAIAAQALGIGQAALDEAIAYAKQREQFGQPIANYQAIQWMLADMATELAAARMLMLKAASAKETQDKSTVEASMAKLAASEAAHKAADKAMQILASAGYRRGSVVERLFRDVRATEIYQGTSEAQRMIIAANVLANG